MINVLNFIENIFQKGRSPLTIREYARTIAHFIEYLENYLGHSVRLKDIKQLDKITLNSYLSYYKKPIKNHLTTDLNDKFLNSHCRNTLGEKINLDKELKIFVC